MIDLCYAVNQVVYPAELHKLLIPACCVCNIFFSGIGVQVNIFQMIGKLYAYTNVSTHQELNVDCIGMAIQGRFWALTDHWW